MNLGKDFWFIIKLVEFIIRVLKEWAKENNDDTPEGEI